MYFFHYFSLRHTILILCLSILSLLIFHLLFPSCSSAIPAFARKYNVNCMVCHTRPPRLNPYGERFLENGYQLPGSEDGGTIGKKRLGDLSLDDVANYLGFRLRGNVLRAFTFHRGPGPAKSDDHIDFAFPEIFSIFTAGTLTNNVGFFVELESNLEEGETGVERGLLSINNIWRHDFAHLRLGRLDPSAYSSYPTLRQQVAFISGETTSNGVFIPPTITRVALIPAAFAAKFSGLFDRKGAEILPSDPTLFHAVSEVGVDLHGRPFGPWLLYQIGVLNGANESFGDSNNAKDWYVMIRLDSADFARFSASLSGFAYFGSNNAKFSNRADVSWNRYGLAANVRYAIIDVYGAFVVDRILDLPASMATAFDTTATGLTLEADIMATDRFLVSFRYDHLDAGGTHGTRTSRSSLAMQAKYYLRSNIALFGRDDVNVRQAEEGTAAARNFRNGVFIGADVVF